MALATDPGADSENDEKLHWFEWGATGSLVRFERQDSAQYPRGMAVGDLDGNGLSDIVVADNGNHVIGIFYQSAPGVFAAQETEATGTNPNAVAVGDLNNDSRADVAVAHANSAFISLYLQQVDGTLAAAVNYNASGGSTNELAIGDIDGDNDNDLVLVRGTGHLTNEIALYYQNSGVLEDAVYLNAQDFGFGAHAGAIGDVTGDGRADLVVGVGGNSPNAKLNLFVQQAGGTLSTSPVVVDALDYPSAIAIGDINNDGRQDVAALHDGQPTLTLYLQQSDGTLGSYESYALPSSPLYQPQALLLADVTQDGGIDAVIANKSSGLLLLTNRRPVGAIIERSLFSNGGSLGTSNSFRLGSSIGQPILGSRVVLTNTNYELQTGFFSAWFAPPPETTITSAPDDPTNSTLAMLEFSANQAGSTFECQIDGSVFTACTSPQSYPGLVAGTHTFRVQATNRNGDSDPTPAEWTWTIDLTVPNSTIDSQPDDPTSDRSATFTFSANEANSSFECQLDNAGFAPCTTPQSYTNLASGSHTFNVRATDPAGNGDSSPATYSWNIETCYSLAIAADPAVAGTVTRQPEPNCDGTQYVNGTEVTLTANPNSNYLFDYWSGSLSGATNPQTVVMDSNKAVVAHFKNEPIEISEVKLSNVRDTNLNISWITSQPVTGVVRYGTDSTTLDQIAYDERGQNTTDDTHYVTIQGLTPETTYYFDLLSGETTDDNDGAHYSVLTSPVLDSPGGSDTIFGKVLLTDSSPAEGSIVYITLEDANGSGTLGESAPLAVQVNSSGDWSVNLANAHRKHLGDYFDYSNGDKVRLEVQGAADGQACQLMTIDQNGQNIPDLVLETDGVCIISEQINLALSWNHISLPLSPLTPYTAEEVCDEIANQGGDIEEIARWHLSGWDGHICGQTFNNFTLELGAGYFIKSNASSTWSIEGVESEEVPLTLQIGWNSIALPHTDGYTADSLCHEIDTQGVTAIEIDRWHNGGWQGHPCEHPFNDFEIERGAGYFVKVRDAGTVTPPIITSQLDDAHNRAPQLLEMVPATQVPIRDLLVSNLQDTALTLSWLTNQPASGYVIFGESTHLGRIAYDTRGATTIGNTHYVVLNNLAPQTTYHVAIVSGGTIDDNRGAYYTITTAAEYDKLPASDTVYGQVLRPVDAPIQGEEAAAHTPAQNAIVTLTLIDHDGTGSPDQARPLTALTDENGYWHTNLGNARPTNHNGPFAYTPTGDTVLLTVHTGTGSAATHTLNVAHLRPAAPLILTEQAPWLLYLPLINK